MSKTTDLRSGVTGPLGCLHIRCALMTQSPSTPCPLAPVHFHTPHGVISVPCHALICACLSVPQVHRDLLLLVTSLAWTYTLSCIFISILAFSVWASCPVSVILVYPYSWQWHSRTYRWICGTRTFPPNNIKEHPLSVCWKETWPEEILPFWAVLLAEYLICGYGHWKETWRARQVSQPAACVLSDTFLI